VPLVATRAYDKPGQYQLMIGPKTAMPMLECAGKNQTATLTLAAATPAVAAAPAAKAGTALPTAKANCPAPLGYFENKSKGQFGCRP